MPAIEAARHPDVYGAGEYAQGTGGSPRVPSAEQIRLNRSRFPTLTEAGTFTDCDTRVGRRGAGTASAFVAGASTTKARLGASLCSW